MVDFFIAIVFLAVVGVMLLTALHRHNVHISNIVAAVTTNGGNKYFWYVVLGIVGIAALIWLAPIMAEWLPQSTGSSLITIGTVLAFLVLVALAVSSAFGKGGSAGKFALLFLAGIATLLVLYQVYMSVTYGDHAADVQVKMQQRNADEVLQTRATRQRAATKSTTVFREIQGEAVWPTAKGEALPVGVWSAWSNLNVGCRVAFAFADDVHRVQYRYYSEKVQEYVAGTSPNMSSFRYMVLKDGVTEAPFTLTCRN